jgi:hypothetical protein
MWKGEKSCPYRDLNSDPSGVRTVASRYTNCAVPASIARQLIGKINRNIELAVQAYELRDVKTMKWDSLRLYVRLEVLDHAYVRVTVNTIIFGSDCGGGGNVFTGQACTPR